MIVYTFLTMRDRDTQPWPLVYQNEQLAIDAPGRISPVVPVDVPIDPKLHQCEFKRKDSAHYPCRCGRDMLDHWPPGRPPR